MTETVRPEGRHGAGAVPRFSTGWSRGRAALYARVSTADQRHDGQLEAMRRPAEARGWDVTEYVDHGVSGAQERRPALDAMMAAVRRREVDVVMVTKLDRLARSLHQLVALGRELDALGVDLVVLDQAIDTTTPSGRLLFHMLAAIAEFERDLIRDRVVAGVRRAQEQGTRSGKPIGRPRREVDAAEVLRRRAAGQTWRKIARALKAPERTLRDAARKALGARENPQANFAPLPPCLASGSAPSEVVAGT